MTSNNIYINKIIELSINDEHLEKYISIITNANLRATTKNDAKNILGYCEKHHILPTSFNMGGEKDKLNYAYLSASEHYTCHELLTKMIIREDLKIKMLLAIDFFKSRLPYFTNAEKINFSLEYEKVASNPMLFKYRSIRAKEHNKKMIEEGTHPAFSDDFKKKMGSLTLERNLQLVAEGKHVFQTKENAINTSIRNAKLVAEGKHNFQSPEHIENVKRIRNEKAIKGELYCQSPEGREKNSIRVAKLLMEGKHNFQSKEHSERVSEKNAKLVAEGKHNFQSPEHIEKVKQSRENKKLREDVIIIQELLAKHNIKKFFKILGLLKEVPWVFYTDEKLSNAKQTLISFIENREIFLQNYINNIRYVLNDEYDKEYYISLIEQIKTDFGLETITKNVGIRRDYVNLSKNGLLDAIHKILNYYENNIY